MSHRTLVIASSKNRQLIYDRPFKAGLVDNGGDLSPQIGCR
jgi:hypothetical protein